MVCIVSLHVLLVYHYWAWYVLLHVMLQLFLLSGMVSHASLIHHYRAWFVFFELMLAGSSLLSIIFRYPSLVLHYWAWFVLIHVMLHLFILAGNDLYCFTSLTARSLLGMVCIVRLPSLVHRY